MSNQFPDIYFKYELVDDEEVLRLSANISLEHVGKLMRIIDEIKESAKQALQTTEKKGLSE